MSIKEDLAGFDPWKDDPMYSSLNSKELESFQEWFFDNCVYCDTHIDYDPLIKLCDPLLGSGCYGNGQFLALSEGLEYAEGIVLPNGSYTAEHIAHAFNIIDGQIADFSFKKIVNESPQYLSEMPGEYWGIIIPNDFISEIQKDKEETPLQLHTPLLVEFWRNETK